MIGVVFSRDRALQLDATLRSFFRHCADPDEITLFVLFRATDARHEQQYRELKTEYVGRVQFIPEIQFRQDLLWLLTSTSIDVRPGLFRRLAFSLTPIFQPLAGLFLPGGRHSHVLFTVDDNIFIRGFSLRSMQDALNAYPRALGFSLRLGSNITYSYTKDKQQSPPKFERVTDNILCFDWTTSEDYFAYPLEVSSSVYRLKQVLPLLLRIRFRRPNSLEDRMSTQAESFRPTFPQLLCFSRSVAFCNPLNMVQTEWTNRASDRQDYSSIALADRFDKGQRISVEEYDVFVPNACHQEVELAFVPREQ